MNGGATWITVSEVAARDGNAAEHVGDFRDSNTHTLQVYVTVDSAVGFPTRKCGAANLTEADESSCE